jgi:hypothetical protein
MSDPDDDRPELLPDRRPKPVPEPRPVVVDWLSLPLVERADYLIQNGPQL